MMNLSPTEMDRLIIFAAAEMARRNRRLGIRLSHPEAVAFLTDEVMLAARRDMAYEDIRDMASRLLTTDDVEPGVAEMIPLIYIECAFAEGTKLMALFEPIGPGEKTTSAEAPPGGIVSPEGEIEIFADSPSVTIDVVNTGDRDIQVRSHTHFFEATARSTSIAPPLGG
jgi:urease subunit gamma/beta